MESLVCLPVDPAYRFLHSCYDQLISVRVSEDENSGADYRLDMNITFVFIAQKHESVIVMWRLLQDENNCIIMLTHLQFFASTCIDNMQTLS